MLFQEKGRCADIHFRPFRRGDGPSFLRCIADFYGDGYPYKEYLEEEFLLEQCRDGEMVVLCGVTPEEEIVSTSAVRLDKDFEGSALLLLRVVRAAYRGMGIGKAQEDRLFGYVEQQEQLASIYADVMTHNCVSQGSLARRGFVYCGLRLMLYRNSVMVPGLKLAEEGKMSQAVMCRREGMADVGTLYCPEEHAKEVQRIYKELGAACRIDTAGSLPCQDTVMSWQEERIHHSAILTIHRAGKDFPDALRARMGQVKEWEDVTVLCYLNCKDPAAVFAYGQLRQAGFFFTGVKPLHVREEYMLLSYIGRQAIRYQDIHLHQDGEAMLSYIRAHQQEALLQAMGASGRRKPLDGDICGDALTASGRRKPPDGDTCVAVLTERRE